MKTGYCESCGWRNHEQWQCDCTPEQIAEAARARLAGADSRAAPGWVALAAWAERKLSEARQAIDFAKQADMKLDGERWCGKAAALVELQEEMARIEKAPPNSAVRHGNE